ncbi:DinB family protein [Rubrolithibacter danxiaensis]|uniref:DinB family protein n=1 Tax=Rubrolithibacter danxiaensis TaxID=3390805 RepID=UPI003BF7B8EE
MDNYFNILTQTRKNFLNVLSGLSIEEVNRIPANFNNNLIWHLGHIIGSQQALCYQLSGNTAKVDMEVFTKYRKGTKPESFIHQSEYTSLQELAVSTLQDLEKDYADKIFSSYTSYPTSYGVELNSIEDAIRFVAVHEGLHLGYIMALKRALNS